MSHEKIPYVDTFSRNDYGRKYIDIFGKQNMSHQHIPQLLFNAVNFEASIGNDIFQTLNLVISLYLKLFCR